MNGLRQSWLVAARELRERSRSRGFLASLILMLVAVAGAIVLPALLDKGPGTKDVGLAGAVPAELANAIQVQGDAVSTELRIHRYDTVAAGEEAVRDGDVDVLVIDARQLEWRRRADEQLKAITTGAIQLVAVRERAVAAGISPDDMLAMVAPVPVENVELSQVKGRSADDENAAFILTLVLFGAITTYGAMVLSGVVEEKSSRTVEVLLARMPARNLLAGKIAGIGLLGLAQIAATGVAALVAGTLVDEVDVSAVRGSVVGWAVVFFVLGYGLYATVFGALGSLASRTEDASSLTGPVTVLLIVAFMASFAAIGSVDTTWARVVGWFPVTSAFAMPNRIAMGAATWWDPVVAVVFMLAAIAGLVVVGGRVYTGAILRTGATVRLGEAWRGAPAAAPTAVASGVSRPAAGAAPVRIGAGAVTMAPSNEHLANGLVIGLAVAVGVAVFAVSRDFVIGLAVGAGTGAIGSRVVKARQHAHH